MQHAMPSDFSATSSDEDQANAATKNQEQEQIPQAQGPSQPGDNPSQPIPITRQKSTQEPNPFSQDGQKWFESSDDEMFG